MGKLRDAKASTFARKQESYEKWQHTKMNIDHQV